MAISCGNGKYALSMCTANVLLVAKLQLKRVTEVGIYQMLLQFQHTTGIYAYLLILRAVLEVLN